MIRLGWVEADIEKNVSITAAINHREFFAESITAYMCNDAPPLFAEILMGIMMHEVGLI